MAALFQTAMLKRAGQNYSESDSDNASGFSQ